MLARLAEHDIPAVILTETEDPGLRSALLERGAVDCLGHPLSVSRLHFLMDLFTVGARRRGMDALAKAEAQPRLAVAEYLFDWTLGEQLLRQIRAIAPLDTTVLLTGETGTGKTHLARVVHDLSPRRNKPFVVVACGALPPSLLESELFGHVRGAFTTADRDQIGRLAAVGDGTLLLDEIDCLPFECQSRLLRAMEERVFEPIGSTKPQPVRARFIAAANRPLEEEKAAGRFRADLYYRLKVATFSLPPLRERKDLIGPLAERFLAEFEARNGQATRGLSPVALEALAAYDWPGNIRELRNVMELAVAFCAGRIVQREDLPDAIRRDAGVSVAAPESADAAGENKLARARVRAEAQQLRDALAQAGNNRTHAAAALGVSRVTLYKKLRRHGLLDALQDRGDAELELRS
jgi:DNA-binding NtrC family response regulator